MSTLLEQASLVLIPSGYKEDVIYSQIPTSGAGDLSFTRASDGTRINSAGLVEVCPWNLISYSEEFTNANWVGSAGVVANSTTAPNGTLTADTNNGAGIYPASGLGDATMSNTSSIYAKANPSGASTITLRVNRFGSGTDYLEVNFNLSTGIAGAVTNSGTASGGVASMESVGNGWYRCILSGTSSTTAGVLSFNPQNDCFIWGAQLNIGSTAKPYFPTTDRLNVPRLTYQNGGGGCPSLLLEKQSTNLFSYSEQFDNAYWSTNSVSITANSVTSPDGTQNADTMTSSGSTSFVYRATSSLTGAHTISFFAKKGTSNFCWVYLNGYNAIFNLNTGVYVTSTSAPDSYSIVAMGNEWYRVTITKTSPALDSVSGIGVSDGNSFNGVVGTNIYIYGAQLEASSYPTSYIPTTSASATRVADACFKTGISSLIGQSEGVLFSDFVCNGFQDYGTPLCINDNSVSNSIWLTTFGDGTLRGEVYAISGGVQATFSMSGGVVGQRYKMALAYKANDFAMYINGTQIGTDSSGSVPPNLSRVDYDFTIPSSYSNSLLKINQAALFKTRLTNAELASLTTL
jgi:hypothetical protein